MLVPADSLSPWNPETNREDLIMNTSLTTETLKQFRIIIGAVRHHFHTLETACGVPGVQVWILSAIAEVPGITVSHLSETLSVHISTASNMLDKLAKAGLVERLRSEKDRRVVNLHLTEPGQAVLDRAPKPLTGLVPHALENLPTKALTRLHEDLNLLIQQMNYVDLDAANKPLSTLVR
jgi:DNA-binding MarR family transcriptional regulator